ncbi:unnamed protein product [Amoebophrya sp. A120]|nr:unnamed protein product [Amoebophrya sp. A120]|eukprot:GSA120T00008004001.1
MGFRIAIRTSLGISCIIGRMTVVITTSSLIHGQVWILRDQIRSGLLDQIRHLLLKHVGQHLLFAILLNVIRVRTMLAARILVADQISLVLRGLSVAGVSTFFLDHVILSFFETRSIRQGALVAIIEFLTHVPESAAVPQFVNSD